MSLDRQDETITMTLMELAALLGECSARTQGHGPGAGAQNWPTFMPAVIQSKDNPLTEDIKRVLKAFNQ